MPARFSTPSPIPGSRRTAELVAAAPDDAVVVQDIPLLVEGGMAPAFHLVAVVHADETERIRRLVELRGMPEADARARIAAQATEEQRREVADVWLDNTGDQQVLVEQVRTLWNDRLVPFEKNLRTGTVVGVDPVLVPRARSGIDRRSGSSPGWPSQPGAQQAHRPRGLHRGARPGRASTSSTCRSPSATSRPPTRSHPRWPLRASRASTMW